MTIGVSHYALFKNKQMNINQYQQILISSSKLKTFLLVNSLALKKRFGQNFLYDKNIIDKIINSMDVNHKQVIEIGAGIGNITAFYYQQPKKIILFEIDNGFYKQLNQTFQKEKNITIIHNDILKENLASTIEKKQKYIFFSNLPYNIASQIIFKLIDLQNFIETIYIMLPDIYDEKLIVPNKIFKNKLGLLLNIYFKITKLFKIKKGSFFPVPEVDSIFLQLSPHNEYLNKINDVTNLNLKITSLFNQKRKILKNTLIKSHNSKILEKYYLKRIEELTLDQVIEIVNYL